MGASGPFEHTFFSLSTLHAHSMPTFSDFCPLCAHFFGSRSPRVRASPPADRGIKFKRMMIHSESAAPASGLAAGALALRECPQSGRRASYISAQSSARSRRRIGPRIPRWASPWYQVLVERQTADGPGFFPAGRYHQHLYVLDIRKELT